MENHGEWNQAHYVGVLDNTVGYTAAIAKKKERRHRRRWEVWWLSRLSKRIGNFALDRAMDDEMLVWFIECQLCLSSSEELNSHFSFSFFA